MSQSTERASSRQQLTRALGRWKGGLEGSQKTLFTTFVEHVVPRLRTSFLAQHHPDQVLAWLEQGFLFAMVRSPEQVHVTIGPRADKGLTVLSCMDDQPFIVDTIRLFLRNAKANYWGGFNMVFNATRDATGKLIAVGAEDGVAESLVLAEADPGKLVDDPTGAATLLRTNLEHARAMVRDFRPMTRSVERLAERCEVLCERMPGSADALRETAAFLHWLLRENFVFMGIDDGTNRLGIQQLEGPYAGSAAGEWPQPHEPGTIRVRKSHMESPVHRSGRIDEILVTLPGADADPLYLRGMFTYRAVTQPSRNVPVLRRVLGSILSETAAAPGSYRYKGLANVFDSLPTEFLFTASRAAIAEMVDLVFDAEQQQEVGVTFLMTGADSAFCLIAMPKGQFGDDLRRQLEHDLVARLKATYCDHGLFIGRYDTVLMHYFLTGVERPSDDEILALTEHVRQIATPWFARVWSVLAERVGEARADRLAESFGRAFPDTWGQEHTAERAVRDIERLEELATLGAGVLADLYDDLNGNPTLRLYEVQDVVLSDLLPVISHFGVGVHSSSAAELATRFGTLQIDTFRLLKDRGPSVEVLHQRSALLTEGLQAVFSGKVASDPLNGLILKSGIDWREADLLRGYARYARQLDVNLADARVQEILLQHPITCGRLVELFRARFDPDHPGDRAAAIAEAQANVGDELRLILSHDAHLIVSELLNLINATVRTNFYRTDRKGYYVSFKFDCSKVRSMKGGRPMFEIYVHSKDVEGVHLRFGKVARGGLRWSDRDDFRTEVLGLATTQLVKNTIIVPTGSKGGFFLKSAAGVEPAERRRLADELYKTFIRGLLDVTDNAVKGVIVPPPRVVRHDPDDAYLVVAADKGTAHLSDTANSLSLEYGFWLGDAFASGGSNGYDHKKVGVTAKGGWVLVKRHFAERGLDPYAQPFTAVGIGDCGGDVFGNGVIETDQMRLIAAFNHLHIFIDPDPDPKRSYAERVRLFKTMGGWDKYDTKLISAGGGVYDKRQRSVPLSARARELLGITEEEPTPEAVIRRILQLDVDLLWNGGIGTYVKASFETHSAADDRSNDAVRVDATELRCKVIGEGGNLGMTQRGRIEAGLLGVALNTDAIDNSGGVDLSDHEVNLKILLSRVVERGDLTLEQRNVLLESMTGEVADLVYKNNDAHGRQLSRDVERSKQDVWQFARAIEFVEREFGRPRAALHLPDDVEIARRAEGGLGLTRPELAVLSAWVKMYVFRELMAGDPKAMPGYEQFLVNYFPAKVREQYLDDIRHHMLADEIAMTVATTWIVADAGAAYLPLVIDTTGARVHEVAAAYGKAQFLARVPRVRTELEQLRASVGLDALYRAWVEIDFGARAVARYWLSTSGRVPTDSELEEMRGATSQVYELQASEVASKNQALLDRMKRDGLPEAVGQRALKAQYLSAALMIWAEARETGQEFAQMSIKHLAVARATRLQEVLDGLAGRSASGRWDPIAFRILYNRFHNLLRKAAVSAPVEPGWLESVDVCEPKLAAGPLKEVRDVVDRLLGEVEEAPSASTLLVLEERLQRALARVG